MRLGGWRGVAACGTKSRGAEQSLMWRGMQARLRWWCGAAMTSMRPLLGLINGTAFVARSLGVLVVHSPTDGIHHYLDHPARTEIPAPPPLDDSSGFYATHATGPSVSTYDESATPTEARRWSPAQVLIHTERDGIVQVLIHPERDGIVQVLVDSERDGIVQDSSAEEAYAFLKARGIRRLLFAGFASNECLLDCRVGVLNMANWGFSVAVLRDATDVLYSPTASPYVSQQDARGIQAGFIEKFVSPTALAADFVALASPKTSSL
ncbi:hypothetical protein T484DRAFT_1888190 [Baffinella frigidus]|nr:hypothetical protein T484DRAFT_1888190 [Cryptophyta sp. CCMP2293]